MMTYQGTHVRQTMKDLTIVTTMVSSNEREPQIILDEVAVEVVLAEVDIRSVIPPCQLMKAMASDKFKRKARIYEVMNRLHLRRLVQKLYVC
jgi:hypothetical protein